MSSFPRRNATRDARLKKKGNGFRKEAEARVVRTSRRRFFAFLSSPKARGFTRADDVRPLRGTASSHRGDGFGCPSCLRDGKRVARAGAARKSGERDVGGVGATFFFFSRARRVRSKSARRRDARRASDRTRARRCRNAATRPLRRLCWNKFSSPTEVSKRAGLIAFVPHSGVSSFRWLFDGRAVGRNGKFKFRERRDTRALDRSVAGALGGDEGSPRRRPRLPRARRRRRRAVRSKFMLSNRQKAGKGFGRTGAACVVVTPLERGGGGGSEARNANAAGTERAGRRLRRSRREMPRERRTYRTHCEAEPCVT